MISDKEVVSKRVDLYLNYFCSGRIMPSKAVIIVAKHFYNLFLKDKKHPRG